MLSVSQSSWARVKLVTLPQRDAVSVNLDHPSCNLVTEERVVALDEGTNHIDFAWKGVSVGADSIQLQALDHPDGVRIINVSYPPNEDALVWEVFSDKAREERLRIYYLLSGFQRTVSYRAVSDAQEETARLEAKFKLTNFSGEDLVDAAIWPGFGAKWKRSIKNASAREMVSYVVDALPVVKRYIYRPAPHLRPAPRRAVDVVDAVDYENVPLYYELRNEEAAGLGEFKMLRGKVRIYMIDPSGSQIFLGEDWMKDLPVQEKAELSLGTARDVVVRRNILSDERENVRRNRDRRVVLSDRVVTIRYEVENFKDEPVELKIVETINDYWRLERATPDSVQTERKDARTLELVATLPPKGDKQEIVITYRLVNQT